MGYFDATKYIDVQERINRFWSQYPGGAIVTKLMGPPDDFDACRYEASVYRDINDIRPAATGYAYELRLTEGKGVNVTSHEENCETSAIGRALANMGYATSRDNRPSSQEIDKVNRTLEAIEDGNLPARGRTTTQNTVPTGEMQYASTRGRVLNGEQPPQSNGAGPQPATPRQLKFIQAIAREHGIGDDELNAEVEQLYGRQVAQLDRRDASAFIERLQSRRNVSDLSS